MPDINSKVEFTYAGTQSSYDSIVTSKEVKSNSIYFVGDTRKIYIGESLVADSASYYILNYDTTDTTKSVFERMVSDLSKYTVYMKINRDNEESSLVPATVNVKISQGSIVEIGAQSTFESTTYYLNYNVVNRELKALKVIENEIPTKTSQLENDSNFLDLDSARNQLIIGPNTTMDYSGYWNYTTTTSGALCAQETIECVQTELAITTPNIIEPICEWNGDTTDKFVILSMFYKISSNIIAPNKILIRISSDDDTSADIIRGFVLSKDSSLEALNLYLYSANSNPVVVVATQSGSLPASVVEQMTGINPGADVPFEEGTYVVKQERLFISKISSVISVKDYIDQKIVSLTNDIENALAAI